jgi:predicted small secreted protein
MRETRFLIIFLLLTVVSLVTTGCNSKPNVSGVWKGTIQASEKGAKNNWQGPAELTLNQNGGAISGTLSFTHPQGGRVQVPLSSGIVSKDSVTFSGQSQFPLGGSLELTFHGKVSGSSLAGTTDMTSRGLFGTVANSGPLTLTKQ